MKNFVVISLFLGVLMISGNAKGQKRPMNVLLFTADDLDRNSLGCYGSGVPNISPNIDKVAREGMMFKHAYVNNSICAPSRAILATGLYGHNSGVTGFMKMKENSDIPLLMELFKNCGYSVGVLSKVDHSTPKESFQWDYVVQQKELGWGRSPSSYYKKTAAFLKSRKADNRPFYLMVNSDDPHRPFFNPEEPLRNGMEKPSRVYHEDEIEVPGFVPDLPDVRKEVSYYYNSVKRLDDTFGRVMQALEDYGFKENTLVIFMSDNGMAFPFAKCNNYYASNRTPWIARWPEGIKAKQVNEAHFISEVDFLPTILEAIGLPIPTKLDGVSRWPLYLGLDQENTGIVYTQIDNKAPGKPRPMRGTASPMRGIQTGDHLYIYNAWADGNRIYVNNNEGISMRAMETAARNDVAVRHRVNFFRYRVLEEFYDLKNDPDCLYNLIDDLSYRQQVDGMRDKLIQQMITYGDPLLGVYHERYQRDKTRPHLYRLYPEMEKIDRESAGVAPRK